MQNTQFRRLVLDTPSGSHERKSVGPANRSTETPSALGSRMRSSIPMTPRSIGGSSLNNFARQLAQRDAGLNSGQTKKFRSSLAPKGTKLAAGYQDRTQLRRTHDEEGKTQRVQALEDMVKLGQIDESTFRQLRKEIVGEDIPVKGLDYKLLERVRRGEDVLAEKATENSEESPMQESEPKVDLEDELEKLETQVVAPVVKEEIVKQGSMVAPNLAGNKRTRDDILKELKAARGNKTESMLPEPPALGFKFKRVGDKKDQSRIERDEKGREVLVFVDADGNVKRKVKEAKDPETIAKNNALLQPDKGLAPLGMEVAPRDKSAVSQAGDLDIFEGVGADYNPLGDAVMSDEDSAEESTEGLEPGGGQAAAAAASIDNSAVALPDSAKADQTDKPRNYFNDSESAIDTTTPSPNPLADPTILAALKRASKIQAEPQDAAKNAEEAAKLARRRKLLEAHDRDAEDMDLGFGGSRAGDEEDGDEAQKVKLSVWGNGEKSVEPGQGRKEKRKRGPKKKKGDGENLADVMRVLEGRKGKAG